MQINFTSLHFTTQFYSALHYKLSRVVFLGLQVLLLGEHGGHHSSHAVAPALTRRPVVLASLNALSDVYLLGHTAPRQFICSVDLIFFCACESLVQNNCVRLH